MCKQFIFWATEYLNYYSLIFWGIKLFLKKYGVKTGRKEWVENAIIIVVSAPVVWPVSYTHLGSGYYLCEYFQRQSI